MIEYTDEQHDSLIRGHRKQLADAQVTVEALQRERSAIEKVLDIDSGKTTLEKVTDLKYSFMQVWASYQDAANEMFKAQAALDAERERYELLNVERNAIDDKRHVLHEQLANTIEAAARQEGELAETQALVANLKSHLSALQALVRAYLEARKSIDSDLAEQARENLKHALDAGKVSTSIIGKQVPPSQWDKNAEVRGDIS